MIKAPDDWFNEQILKNNGIFDRPSYEMCIRNCNKFRIAVDCGAHVGSWTYPLSNIFKKVYAIEANPANYEYLVKNVDKKKNINLHNIAIGESSGAVDIVSGSQNSGQSHVTSGNSIKLDMLDNIIPDIDKPLIDFIKMDIEGYELFAVRGAIDIITLSRPNIMVELNGLSERYSHTDQDVVSFLNSLGYVDIDKTNKDHFFKHKSKLYL